MFQFMSIVLILDYSCFSVQFNIRFSGCLTLYFDYDKFQFKINRNILFQIFKIRIITFQFFLPNGFTIQNELFHMQWQNLKVHALMIGKGYTHLHAYLLVLFFLPLFENVKFPIRVLLRFLNLLSKRILIMISSFVSVTSLKLFEKQN